MSYPNYIFSIFTFIGFLLTTIPLPWHLEAWNTGTCLYMIWTSLACLNQFINSIIWNGNAINWVPVWCDISTRFEVGVSVAIPAASLCINRRLYHIACVKSVTVTKAERRRAIMVDLAIGVGIPLLQMVLQIIPQGHRFNIYEDIGCLTFTYNTPVAFALYYVWPIVIGLVSAVYCVLSIRAFNKRRTQFKELLSTNSSMNTNRYFRLMGLAGIEVLCTIPLASYVLFLNTSTGAISPWISWENTHADFHRVDQMAAIEWRAIPPLAHVLELTRWSPFVCAVVFFAFFGFADEARKNYRLVYSSAAKRVGLSTGLMSSGLTSSNGSKSFNNMSSNGGGSALPVFVHKNTITKRDSFDSFSDMSVTDVGSPHSLKEKHSIPSYEGLSLPDIGGALGEYNEKDVYPTSGDSTGSSSTLPPSPTESDSESLSIPEAAVTRPRSLFIEISSARNSFATPDAAPVPQPTHSSPLQPQAETADMV